MPTDSKCRSYECQFNSDKGWPETVGQYLGNLEANNAESELVNTSWADQASVSIAGDYEVTTVVTLPRFASWVLSIDEIRLLERGWLRHNENTLCYLLSIETNVKGGLFTEYAEIADTGDGKTLFMCYYTTEAPSWLPEFAVKKAAALYGENKGKERAAEGKAIDSVPFEEFVDRITQNKRLVEWFDKSGFTADWLAPKVGTVAHTADLVTNGSTDDVAGSCHEQH